ncbi:MAG TPA: hypothetical protein VFZ45_04190, partial [Actinomycetota bacterium]|nr:hypothetical protein [Actinomycetota bacterium]
QVGAEPAWASFGSGSIPEATSAAELELVHRRAELPDLVARYVQAELARAAIDLELVALEADVLHGDFLPSRRFDLALVEVRTGPSPELWHWVEMPEAGASLTGLADPALAELVRRGAAGSTGALGAAQRRLADLAAVLPLYRPRVTVGWRTGIAGPEANPTVEGPLWNVEAWSTTSP